MTRAPHVAQWAVRDEAGRVWTPAHTSPTTSAATAVQLLDALGGQLLYRAGAGQPLIPATPIQQARARRLADQDTHRHASAQGQAGQAQTAQVGEGVDDLARRLLALIVAEPGITERAAARHLKATPETLRRRLKALAAAGTPVHVTTGRHGGLSLTRQPTTPERLHALLAAAPDGAWMSTEALADALGVSVKSVARAVGRLRGEDVVVRARHGSVGGYQLGR